MVGSVAHRCLLPRRVITDVTNSAMFCTSGKQAYKRAQQGFDMVNVTNDVAALTESLSLNLAAAAGEGAA